jgi:hypothetical protein
MVASRSSNSLLEVRLIFLRGGVATIAALVEQMRYVLSVELKVCECLHAASFGQAQNFRNGSAAAFTFRPESGHCPPNVRLRPDMNDRATGGHLTKCRVWASVVLTTEGREA